MPRRDQSRAPGRSARRHALTVALEAALVAAVVYLAAATLIDDVATTNALHDLDARLAVQLAQLTRSHDPDAPRFTSTGVTGTLDTDDLTDTPIVAWWVPRHRPPVALDRATPPLPPRLAGVGAPTTASVGGQRLRLEGEQLAAGRLVVGSVTADVDRELRVLLVVEVALGPLVLAGFFLVAWIIGRRALAPVEAARQSQLDFTADASHELRTPLSVIEAEVGRALSHDRAAADYRDALERVAAESGRLRRIVDDLLWLARFEHRPAAPPSEQVDLRTLAAQCVDRFAPVAAEGSVTLELAPLDGDDPLVAAPPEWLDRLVAVLVDNACRYTPAGGRVRVAAAVAGGRSVLAVDDSGPGIAPEERDRVLEPFRRASSVAGGAGLGLAIADAVVAATGGRWEIGESPFGGAHLSVSWEFG